MRAKMYELSIAELKDLYIHEMKALLFALEAGIEWKDMKYIRDSLSDISTCIERRVPSDEAMLFMDSVDNLPPPPVRATTSTNGRGGSYTHSSADIYFSKAFLLV
jgi:hypothetical protein